MVGLDSDESSVSDAREHAAQAGLGDRVRFETVRADDDLAGVVGTCDVVLVLEALHDMAHPVAALAAARAALREGGCVVVMDEAAAEQFAPPPPGHPEAVPVSERLFYASSVLHCLPVGLSEADSAGTGAVMRPATLRRYAEQAGLGDVRDAPVEHDMFRFTVLRPG